MSHANIYLSRFNDYINSCANSYAENVVQGLSPEEQGTVTPAYRDLLTLDYKVSNFNVATFAMITAIALGALFKSIPFLLLGFAAGCIRSILLTRILIALPPQSWKMIDVEFLQLILRMNRLSIPSPTAKGFVNVSNNVPIK